MSSVSIPKKPVKFRSARRKKRRAPCVGRQPTISEPATSSATAEGEVPIPILTASGKKLALSLPSVRGGTEGGNEIGELGPSNDGSSSAEATPVMEGNRLLDCQTLLAAVRKLARCADCSAPLEVRENQDLGFRNGVVTKMWLACSHCDQAVILSDPRKSRAVNSKAVLASKLSGIGCSRLDMVCRVLGLPPSLSAPSYSEYNKELAKLCSQQAEASFLRASEELHRLRGVSNDTIIDVIVTCDGTWSKRGFTANYGVVVVLSWETGQVLDVVVLSKSCPECKAHADLDEDSEDFRLWWEGHEEICNQNYEGSSPAMEPEGALRIWQRSVEKLKLRFTTV